MAGLSGSGMGFMGMRRLLGVFQNSMSLWQPLQRVYSLSEYPAASIAARVAGNLTASTSRG